MAAPHAPTEAQRLLLRAALLPGADALEAHAAWQAATRASGIDQDSTWLLPLLYCNLSRAGAPQAGLRRYANVYRHNWYKNNLLLRAAGPALAALAEGGPPPALLGGAALVAGCPALGARPLEAVDILAPLANVAAAVTRLGALGWQTASAAPAEGRQLILRDAHGRGLRLWTHVLGAQAHALMLAGACPEQLPPPWPAVGAGSRPQFPAGLQTQVDTSNTYRGQEAAPTLAAGVGEGQEGAPTFAAGVGKGRESDPSMGAVFREGELGGRATVAGEAGAHAAAWQAWPSLDPADQLVFLLAHRESWDSRSGLLWLCDAALLLASLSPDRHASLLPRARQLGAAQAVADGLAEASAWGLGALLALPEELAAP